jgi:anti-sigma28 factor (negative regulator of flagellin synthesis)
MKVQNSNSANLSRLGRTATVAPGGNLRSPGAGPGRGDHVQISTLSSSTLTALDLQSGDRAAKVVQLSDAVASGRYQVDAYAVSGKLIQEHMLAAA